MKKNSLIVVLICLFIFKIHAQDAAWTDFNKRQQLYPPSEYFTGFTMEEVNKKEDLGKVYESLKEVASANLSKTIQVTMKSTTILNKLEINNQLKEDFRKSVTSLTKMNLAGIKSLTHFDKKSKMAYVLAYARKSEIRDYYQKVIQDKKETLAQKIKLAEQQSKLSDKDEALKTYYQCLPLFEDVAEAQTYIILLEANNTDFQQIKDYELKVKSAISNLYSSDQLSLEDVCSFMTFGLNMQTAKLETPILLSNFTFEDTKMGSAFSRRLKKELEKELINSGGYQVKEMVYQAEDTPEYEYILRGTYWTEGNKLKIIATLRKLEDGKALASVDAYLPLTWLEQNNISWKPENFAQAHENMMQFRKDEIVDGNMSLDVWTNKGNDSPIFEDKDTLAFYVRVSHPCYLRIINHFADGSRVLLVDNEFIGADKVNKVVKIRHEFECAEPFGAEVLQVNAQTEKFNPLMIQPKWGYNFIKNDLNEILANTRGFKPLKNEDLKAEKRIVVTTMAR